MNKIIAFLSLAVLGLSCTDNKHNSKVNEELNAVRAELDSLKSLESKRATIRKEQIATFLTFQKDNAEDAMNYYVNLFDNSEIINIQR